jgi:hypothetical protein
MENKRPKSWNIETQTKDQAYNTRYLLRRKHILEIGVEYQSQPGIILTCLLNGPGEAA